MTQKILTALKKVGIVALHWLVAIVILYGLDYLTNHTLSAEYGQFLTKYGIPLSIINMVQTAVVSWLKKEAAENPLPLK